MTRRSFLFASLLVAAMPRGSWGSAPEGDFAALRDDYVARVRPLEKTARLNWWEASTTGADEAYRKRELAENALAELHADREVFARLKALQRGGGVRAPLLARQLDTMVRAYLPRQVDEDLTRRIIALEAEVDQVFNTHRSLVDGEELSENAVRDILKDTSDTERARKAWTGYMEVGRKVAPRLRELVRLRNESARHLGFRDFFAMSLVLQELEEVELFRLFDDLDRLTREPFGKLKGEIDAAMARRFSLPESALRPWHTGDLFFQEAPDLGELRLDHLYVGKNPVQLSKAYYDSLGFAVDDILARSDLYEKPGKSPHAFCTTIDRDQDVRVLCNVKPDSNWMDTVNHELGHGVYDKYIGADVPFVLHEPSHIMTTEGVALLFGALTKTGDFLGKVVGVPAPDLPARSAGARASLRAEKLIFSRWAQVMLRFEKVLYANPDQDLNATWWGLKARYQDLALPEDRSGADYAAKMHVVGAPCYYHNYLLGDLFACQVWQHVARQVVDVQDPHATCFHGSREAGRFLVDKVFAPGNTVDWRTLTRDATGQPLTARHYAEMYVD